MKRIVIYGIILAVVLLIPVDRMDIRDLEPIQAVWMYLENGNIVLKTDTDDQGTGETVLQALNDMKHKSSGIVYLDTAQFLMVSETAQEHIGELVPFLKEKVKVSLWEGGEIKDAAKYMQSHKIGVKLSRWNQKVKLPKLPV